jgi:3D (Asp-Asp-Asp) domain-containing protein
MMKQMLASVLTVVLALSSFAGLQAEAATKKSVKSTVDSLVIRQKATTSSKKLGLLYKNQTLSYKAKTGNWYKVSYKGKTAYLSASNTKVVTSAGSKKQSTGGWKTIKNVSAIAYTPYDPGSGNLTAIGWNIKSSKKKVVAVDPRVIPLRSTVKVYYKGKLKGTNTAADTGGAIKGKKMDILYYSRSEAFNWGRRTVTVKCK